MQAVKNGEELDNQMQRQKQNQNADSKTRAAIDFRMVLPGIVLGCFLLRQLFLCKGSTNKDIPLLESTCQKFIVLF